MFGALQSYSKEIATLLAVVFAFGLSRVFRPRAKLVYSFRHAFDFLVDEPLRDSEGETISTKQLVRTASITVRNSGIEPAQKVELTFNWRPRFVNIWPARHFEEKESAHGRYSIYFDSLAPGESCNVELLAINVALPGLTVVRSDQSEGVKVEMSPQQVAPRWQIVLAGLLATIGFAAVVYSAILAVQLFARTG